MTTVICPTFALLAVNRIGAIPTPPPTPTNSPSGIVKEVPNGPRQSSLSPSCIWDISKVPSPTTR